MSNFCFFETSVILYFFLQKWISGVVTTRL